MTAACASSTPAAKSLPPASTPERYSEYIGEKVEPWSYLKSTYYKPKGYPMASTGSALWRG